MVVSTFVHPGRGPAKASSSTLTRQSFQLSLYYGAKIQANTKHTQVLPAPVPGIDSVLHTGYWPGIPPGLISQTISWKLSDCLIHMLWYNSELQ